MDLDKRKQIVDMLNDVGNALRNEDGFFSDQSLKASFLVVHTAAAVIKFNEEESFAEVCSEFCKNKACEEDGQLEITV
jgi:hypothetical protein